MKYNMKSIKTNIFLFAMLAASPLVVNAQTADEADAADTTVVKKKVHVAFRDKDPDHLLGGISYVDVEELQKKDYTMSSLEDMYALVGGWNGNHLWGMDNDRLDNNDNANMPLVIIDGVKRPSNNVLPSEIEQITFLKGAQAVVLYGAKGAKGAILITTKRGKVDGLQITANANTGFHVAKEFPEYLGSAEYMTLYNEALLNDAHAMGSPYNPKYTQQDIYNHASGLNPYRYPNVNYYSDEYVRKMYNRSEGTVEIQGGEFDIKLVSCRSGSGLGVFSLFEAVVEPIDCAGQHILFHNISIFIDGDIIGDFQIFLFWSTLSLSPIVTRDYSVFFHYQILQS